MQHNKIIYFNFITGKKLFSNKVTNEFTNNNIIYFIKETLQKIEKTTQDNLTILYNDEVIYYSLFPDLIDIKCKILQNYNNIIKLYIIVNNYDDTLYNLFDINELKYKYSLCYTTQFFKKNYHIYKKYRCIILLLIYYDKLPFCDLLSLDDKYKNDKELIYIAYQINGDILRYVCKDLLNNKEFILKGISYYKFNCSNIFTYISDELKKDKDIINNFVENDPGSFEYLSADCKLNKELILKSINQKNNYDAYSLNYINNELRNDKNFMISCININCNTYHYVSDNLKYDKDIGLAAVINGFHYNILHNTIKYDSNILLEALKTRKASKFKEYTTIELQTDVNFIYKAVTNNPLVIKFIDKNILENNKEIIIITLNNINLSKNIYVNKQKDTIVFYIPDKYKIDKEICLLIIKYNLYIKWIDDSLLIDKEFINNSSLDKTKNLLKN